MRAFTYGFLFVMLKLEIILHIVYVCLRMWNGDAIHKKNMAEYYGKKNWDFEMKIYTKK